MTDYHPLFVRVMPSKRSHWPDTLPASVQDASLLAMLRVAAECDEVPSDIVNSVTSLGQSAGRHIRQVCCPFEVLTANPVLTFSAL
jgi:hypothetical protein